jgi:hypothetical protein
MILRCSPILEDHCWVVVECHQARHDVNPATIVYRKQALHNYRREIEPIATLETGLLEVPAARNVTQAHVRVTFHPNGPAGAMPAISLGSPAESGLALLSAGHSQIKKANSAQIV